MGFTNTTPKAVLAVFSLCLATGCAAGTANKALNTDIMTASGRLALDSAAPDGPLYEAVRVEGYTLGEAVPRHIQLDVADSEARLREGLARSLANHDFLVADDSEGVRVQAAVDGLAFETVEEGEFVIVTTRFSADDAQTGANPGLSCLNQTLSARWLVLDPLNSGSARRMTSAGTAVALAFLGIDASNLITVQFEDAAAHNRAINREFGEQTGASVGLRGDLQGSRRIGFQNAVRLSHAAYISQLGYCVEQAEQAESGIAE